MVSYKQNAERQLTYSGNPEGESTILMTSLTREAFMTRSLGVVYVSEGEAFTWQAKRMGKHNHRDTAIELCFFKTLYQPMTHICVMSSHKPI